MTPLSPDAVERGRRANQEARREAITVYQPALHLSDAKTALPDKFVGMNKLEAKRARELDAMKLAGEIRDWWYESVTLRLAFDTRYTPDFLVQENDGSLRLEEIKGGFFRDDAKVKAKVCASLYPFPLTVLQQRKKGEGWVLHNLKP